MPESKPYRVYHGGRSRARLPSRRAAANGKGGNGRRTAAEAGPAPAKAAPSWRRWLRFGLIGLGALAFLVIVWAIAGFLSVSSGLDGANKRLPASARAALDAQHGSLLTSPTDILLLSVDHSTTGSLYRQTDDNSDAMMIVRTEPSEHRIVYLSIPRDLRVDLSGYGEAKINSAMQFGGPELSIQAVEALTGLPINHVAIVNFSSFEQLIAALGGVEIYVPENILSNRFDCPYSTEARCLEWPGWRFHKGWQHLDARQALIYSRIRTNQLDPSDTDITREEHQQELMEAVLGELVSVGTFMRLPFDGSSLVAPLATDLSAFDLLQLGWVKFRAGSTLNCRLGGTPLDIDGTDYLEPSPENEQVVRMVLGEARPQPPASGTLYAPGCTS